MLNVALICALCLVQGLYEYHQASGVGQSLEVKSLQVVASGMSGAFSIVRQG